MARLARYQYIEGRGKPHKISYWREDGSRAAKFFKEQGEALIFQAKLNETEKDDLPDNLVATIDDRIILSQIKSECKRLNATLSDALACVKVNLPDYLNINSVKGCNWDYAVKLYLDHCAKRGARPSTLRGYNFQIFKAKKNLNANDVKDITVNAAKEYLSCIKSPDHAKRALRTFFAFCKDNCWVSLNPFDHAKTPRILREREHPHIITPDACRKLLNAVPDAWQPAFALMAFAGLRPGEVVSPEREPVIKVANVDFKNKRITVPAEVAKTRITRVLTALPDNIWAWLAPLQKLPKDDNVAPASYDVYRRVKHNSGVSIPKDALRHSFASYGYHFLGAEKTVEMLGHIGGFGVFAKHYKGLASPDDSNQYFSINP